MENRKYLQLSNLPPSAPIPVVQLCMRIADSDDGRFISARHNVAGVKPWQLPCTGDDDHCHQESPYLALHYDDEHSCPSTLFCVVSSFGSPWATTSDASPPILILPPSRISTTSNAATTALPLPGTSSEAAPPHYILPPPPISSNAEDATLVQREVQISTLDGQRFQPHGERML